MSVLTDLLGLRLCLDGPVVKFCSWTPFRSSYQEESAMNKKEQGDIPYNIPRFRLHRRRPVVKDGADEENCWMVKVFVSA